MSGTNRRFKQSSRKNEKIGTVCAIIHFYMSMTNQFKPLSEPHYSKTYFSLNSFSTTFFK